MSELVPTPRLRWVQRPSIHKRTAEYDVKLQQWWAQDLPTYMRDVAQGEWRDIPVERVE